MKLTGRISLIGVAVVAVGALAIFATWRSFLAPSVDNEIHRLVRETAPPDSRPLPSIVFNRSAEVLDASWTFLSHQSQKAYFDWLAIHVPNGYSVVESNDSQLTLRKQLPGDLWTVRIATRTDAGGLRIDVHFVGIAD